MIVGADALYSAGADLDEVAMKDARVEKGGTAHQLKEADVVIAV